MYVLLPEVTYYLLVYSVLKVFEIKTKLIHKIFSYTLGTPNILSALIINPFTKNNLGV